MLCSGSAMTRAIEMSHLALVETLMKALQGVGYAPTLTVSLPRFLGRPESPGDPTIVEGLSDFDFFVRQCGVPAGERAVVLVGYLGGYAKEEVLYVTRMRFFGTSGLWCLCCGRCLGRGRP